MTVGKDLKCDKIDHGLLLSKIRSKSKEGEDEFHE